MEWLKDYDKVMPKSKRPAGLPTLDKRKKPTAYEIEAAEYKELFKSVDASIKKYLKMRRGK